MVILSGAGKYSRLTSSSSRQTIPPVLRIRNPSREPIANIPTTRDIARGKVINQARIAEQVLENLREERRMSCPHDKARSTGREGHIQLPTERSLSRIAEARRRPNLPC